MKLITEEIEQAEYIVEEAGNGKTLEEQFEETGKKNNDENPRLRKRKKK